MPDAPQLPAEAEAAVDPWATVLDLVCSVVAEVPVPGFTLGDLLTLKLQDVIKSGWAQVDDVPLLAGGQVIAAVKFEVAAGRVAVRIAELR
jgi:flagellar motor switch/type III secretory pathway protein FliN